MLGFAPGLFWLFISCVIDGLSGGNIATAQAVITDSTNEKTRTQGLGLIGAAFGLGFIIGPLIAFLSLALSGNNYHVPAFMAAAFSLISILLTWFWLEELHPVEKRGQAQKTSAFSFGAMAKAVSHPTVGVLLIPDLRPTNRFRRLRAASRTLYPNQPGAGRIRQLDRLRLCGYYRGDGGRLLHRQVGAGSGATAG